MKPMWNAPICRVAAAAIALLFCVVSNAQGLLLKRAQGTLTIDGVLDEADWFTGEKAANFWETFPSDTSLCAWKTEVFMTFDDANLYIAARCESPGNNYVVPSLRRDYRAGGSDNITFVIDPFRDRTNAFVFGMNPYGVMREALISNGGRMTEDFLEQWDNVWRGNAKMYDNYWTCELAIPLSTLRFPEGSTEWYFNCYRFDTQSNTRSTWQPIPQNQIIMSLAYMGNMHWEEAPRSKGSPLSIIPFVTAGALRNHEEGLPRETVSGIGADAKIAVTTGLNLDLTVNPDFSQVEVDRQVVNLDRFEIFFPERRQFFLENADLFGTFGDDRANPFFSRRIGIATDTTDDSNISNRIYYGARLSGKLDNNWRLGLLNMHTEQDKANGRPSYNYTVGVLQRKVFARSNVGFIMVNKQTFDDPERYAGTDNTRFNRVMGLDYNLASADNRWLGKAWVQRSFSPQQADKAHNYGARLGFRNRHFELGVEQRGVGAGFVAETGFVPRTNYWQIVPWGQLFFYPSKGRVNRHGPGFRSLVIFTPEDGNTDRLFVLFWNVQYNNNAILNARLSNEYILLLDEFDPTGTDATPLPALTDYSYYRLSASYDSDRTRKISYSVEPSLGQYFNGKRFGFDADLTWRYQPYGQVAMQIAYNYIDLPMPYSSTSLFLIGPRIDFTFSKSVFLTTFFQYNSQVENVNINARLQWRFAPVSDLFLVYTDNYDSMNWRIKNRALIFKATYWLNV